MPIHKIAQSALVLEEPEGHLHGRLQRALAEEIIDVVERARRESSNRDTFTDFPDGYSTRYRDGSAKRTTPSSGTGNSEFKALSASDVSVCLIERDGNASYIRRLDLDNDGAPRSSELMDFFSEEHSIARDLFKARRQR